jgi:hypothetical protein
MGTFEQQIKRTVNRSSTEEFESGGQFCPLDEAAIDGAELLDDVERFAGPFFAFRSIHYLVVLVLWIAHTWAVGAFYVTPRLIVDSPEPGCGKTRVLEILERLCHKGKQTLSTTTAALYRRIAAAGDAPPTILQDEADAVFGRTNNPQAEDLRALFNSGYTRGATVDRCEGDAKNMRVVEFPVFAPLALAGIAGKMKRTVTDRAAAVLHMQGLPRIRRIRPRVCFVARRGYWMRSRRVRRW